MVRDMSEPRACALPVAVLADRRRLNAELAARALHARELVPGGIRLRFPADAETERELRALVAAEAECCPFLELALGACGGALTLDVTGPVEARPLILDFLR